MSDTVSAFADLGLPASMLAVLEALGYETPSPIQAAAIPVLLAGHDLIGQAQTGTGKTAAFALPLLARLDPAAVGPQILVLTPTRELAIQVAEACQRYAHGIPGFHVVPIYGGQSMHQQLHQLRRGVHVVVGTPGRVMDHLRRESLSLAKLSALVLDEADEMLRMGFLEDVEWILEHTPPTRQTALFSATMPDAIRDVARRHLREPREIRIKAKTSTVEAVRQRYWQVGGLYKLDALTRMLEVEETDAVLIFVRTKTATVELAEKLEARGYACAALNGDMNQAQREKAIEQLKNEELDIVIATDVAARGLDVPRISHVINYDVPYDIESYVHRIGRTGRAGRPGEAILFVAPREMRLLRAIERATRQPIEPMRAPSLSAIADRRGLQFREAVAEHLAREDLDFFEALVREIADAQDVDPARVGAALAWMVQRERPLRFESGPAPRAEREPAPAPAREARAAPAARPGRLPRPAELDEFLATPPREQAPVPAAAGRRAPRERSAEVDMLRYRLDVGLTHGATPKHIVGAIANEAGLDSRYIGRVELFDDYTLVDLPAGMPRELLQHMKKVRFGKFRFNLRPADEAEAAPRARRDEDAAPARTPRPAGRDGAPRSSRDDRPPRADAARRGAARDDRGPREAPSRRGDDHTPQRTAPARPDSAGARGDRSSRPGPRPDGSVPPRRRDARGSPDGARPPPRRGPPGGGGPRGPARGSRRS
ncbi:MAG TPA: DEAD/DEAH box helicase [Gammaproteobacteria bacterium]|nr:DEAD/DEAH box helicase [Gammaproteobacteria bacterium]